MRNLEGLRQPILSQATANSTNSVLPSAGFARTRASVADVGHYNIADQQSWHGNCFKSACAAQAVMVGLA
jgi:hypothetical protein